MDFEVVISELGLEALEQEGGWFRRIFTGEPDEVGRPRVTSINALFTREQFSALHRLDADEQFFHLEGDPFEVFRIDVDGTGKRECLGTDLSHGQRPHLIFEKGCWFAGMPIEGGNLGWTLIGAVVTPGFQWKGFELGKRDELIAMYPEFRETIERLTR